MTLAMALFGHLQEFKDVYMVCYGHTGVVSVSVIWWIHLSIIQR